MRVAGTGEGYAGSRWMGNRQESQYVLSTFRLSVGMGGKGRRWLRDGLVRRLRFSLMGSTFHPDVWGCEFGPSRPQRPTETYARVTFGSVTY